MHWGPTISKSKHPQTVRYRTGARTTTGAAVHRVSPPGSRRTSAEVRICVTRAGNTLSFQRRAVVPDLPLGHGRSCKTAQEAAVSSLWPYVQVDFRERVRYRRITRSPATAISRCGLREHAPTRKFGACRATQGNVQ